MKLSTSFLLGYQLHANPASYEVWHEPVFNIAIDQKPVLFYSEFLNIETELHIKSSCSTIENNQFSCDAFSSHGRKTNDFLSQNKAIAVETCKKTNELILQSITEKSSVRNRRNALLEVGKTLLTSLSPLTADALAIIQPYLPELYKKAKKAFTSHSRHQSSRVVRSKTDFETEKLEQQLCSQTSLSLLAAHPNDQESSLLKIMGQTLANQNLVKIERMFNALRQKNFDSSDIIEDLLLRVCHHHTTNAQCQAMIDLAVIRVEPVTLQMSPVGDILLKLRVRVPRKLNNANLYTLHSNGRLLPNGILEQLVITPSVLHVRQRFYNANGIKCTSNIANTFCHHSSLTSLGCESDILVNGNASSCPVATSKWDKLKPKTTSNEHFTLFSTTETCTLCKNMRDSLDGSCTILRTNELIPSTGIITCPNSITRTYHDTQVITRKFNMTSAPEPSLDSINSINDPGQGSTDHIPRWLQFCAIGFCLINGIHLLMAATKDLLRRLSRQTGEATKCTNLRKIKSTESMDKCSATTSTATCDDTTSMKL